MHTNEHETRCAHCNCRLKMPTGAPNGPLIVWLCGECRYRLPESRAQAAFDHGVLICVGRSVTATACTK